MRRFRYVRFGSPVPAFFHYRNQLFSYLSFRSIITPDSNWSDPKRSAVPESLRSSALLALLHNKPSPSFACRRLPHVAYPPRVRL
jgi:hypothetical protein